MRITVWVDSWQYQCCGDAFGVGNAISWRLGASDDDWLDLVLGDRMPAPVGSLSVLDHLGAEGSPGLGVIVGVGGLRVFVRDDDATSGADGGCWVGVPYEDHHVDVPEDAPATEAVVQRIRLIRVAHHEDPSQQASVPTAGSGTTEDVDPAPKWPADKIDGARFSGFLVDVDVADEI